jgi:hypothetical protein
MAKAVIEPGNCGYTCIVEAAHDPENLHRVTLKIQSNCKAIQRLAEALPEVDPYQEISFRGKVPQTLQVGAQFCSHAACPVPVGIIKTIEVAAGLALEGEVTIRISNDAE